MVDIELVVDLNTNHNPSYETHDKTVVDLMDTRRITCGMNHPAGSCKSGLVSALPVNILTNMKDAIYQQSVPTKLLT